MIEVNNKYNKYKIWRGNLETARLSRKPNFGYNFSAEWGLILPEESLIVKKSLFCRADCFVQIRREIEGKYTNAIILQQFLKAEGKSGTLCYSGCGSGRLCTETVHLACPCLVSFPSPLALESEVENLSVCVHLKFITINFITPIVIILFSWSLFRLFLCLRKAVNHQSILVFPTLALALTRSTSALMMFNFFHLSFLSRSIRKWKWKSARESGTSQTNETTDTIETLVVAAVGFALILSSASVSSYVPSTPLYQNHHHHHHHHHRHKP